MDHGLAAEGMDRFGMLLVMFLFGSVVLHLLVGVLATIGFCSRVRGARPSWVIALIMLAGYHSLLLWLGAWPLFWLLSLSTGWGLAIILCELYVTFGRALFPSDGTRGSSSAPDRWIAPDAEEVGRVLQGRRG